MTAARRHRRDALRAALLASERLRFRTVLAIIAIILAIDIARVLLLGPTRKLVAIILTFVALGIVEVAAYFKIRKDLRETGKISGSILFAATFTEICVPSLFIPFIVAPQLPAAYRALATPWVSIAFPLITLSTLRLRPALSWFAGITACVLYMGAAFYHGWRPILMDQSGHAALQTGVPFYAVILLGSGFVASAVAAEIRKHLRATLSDIETNLQLKRIQRDMEIARSIQRSLLPQASPTLRNFAVAGWNRSADDTGGDFFDWIDLADGRLLVMLADVTGHGIGPALLAAVCRAYARASFQQHDTLSGTMQQINRLLAADVAPPHFATFAAVLCDEKNGQIQLLSAGQGPLFVYSSNNRVFTEVMPQAIPLGLMADLGVTDPTTIQMEPGDLLVLVTDGFLEWQNAAGDQFGSERLTQTVLQAANLKPEDIITELYRAVVAFADGAAQQDDLTAIVIKRVAASDDHTEESSGSLLADTQPAHAEVR